MKLSGHGLSSEREARTLIPYGHRGLATVDTVGSRGQNEPTTY